MTKHPAIRYTPAQNAHALTIRCSECHAPVGRMCVTLTWHGIGPRAMASYLDRIVPHPKRVKLALKVALGLRTVDQPKRNQ